MKAVYLAAVAATAALGAAAPAGAQDAGEGAWLYGGFCATCHGEDGTGNGPMTAVLTIQPADLTALSAGNGGVFPTGRVASRIDGRDAVMAHGGPMPLFGRYFEGDDVAISAEGGQPMMTSRGIADLIAYLETIQK